MQGQQSGLPCCLGSFGMRSEELFDHAHPGPRLCCQVQWELAVRVARCRTRERQQQLLDDLRNASAASLAESSRASFCSQPRVHSLPDAPPVLPIRSPLRSEAAATLHCLHSLRLAGSL